MTQKDKNEKSIQDKLTTIKYNCDSNSHLSVDLKKCAKIAGLLC